jgi:arsenate reductase (thioredoxin)
MADVPQKILFVCLHNSARSQMAEAFLTKYGHGKFIADSAGIEPGKLNPNVIKVMRELGIDLSKKTTQGVFDLFSQGKHYNGVITVCDAASAERCPIFPGNVKRVAWSFTDPSSFKGTEEEVLNQTRQVRNEIEKTVREFVQRASSVDYWK